MAGEDGKKESCREGRRLSLVLLNVVKSCRRQSAGRGRVKVKGRGRGALLFVMF